MKEPMVITMAREYASGGSEIAQAVADKLGIPLYNKELITLAAKKSGLTEEAIAAGYKNRGIAPEIAKAWVDDGWGMYGLPEEYGGKPVDHQTMAMIIEELNHCGGNIPMAPNLLIMFDMVEFGTPEQIQYVVDYYKENG